jgi:hypothetical protein
MEDDCRAQCAQQSVEPHIELAVLRVQITNADPASGPLLAVISANSGRAKDLVRK